MADQNKTATYNNGPGNVPRLPDRVVDTLIDSADVSRCAPGRGCTVVDQTAAVERLVHDTCEELLARLPDLAAPAVPDVAGLADERIYELVADHELRTRKLFGQVVFDSTTVLSFARAIEGEILATKASADLEGLTRYGLAESLHIGDARDIVPDPDGTYYLVSDVQALLATPKGAEPAALDALLTRIDDAFENYERHGAVCEFEGQPMIYASTLIEIIDLRGNLHAAGLAHQAEVAAPQSIDPQQLRAALKSAELGMGSYHQNYDGNRLGCAIEELLAAAPEKVAAPEGWRVTLENIAEWLNNSAQIVQNAPDDYGPATQFDYELGQAAAEILSLLAAPAVPPVPAPAPLSGTEILARQAAMAVPSEQPSTSVSQFGASAGITPEYVAAQQAKNAQAREMLDAVASTSVPRADGDGELQTWPERIYLQHGNGGEAPSYRDLEGATWCRYAIKSSDVEYVRSDLAHVARQPAAATADAAEAAELQTLLIDEFSAYRPSYPAGLYAWARIALLDNSPHRASPVARHPDDIAVDSFAAAMKAKMAKQRAKGYGGWDQVAACTDKSLADKLMEHTKKGDPVDVANFCMMLHQRNQDQVDFAIGTLRGASLDFSKRVASMWIPSADAGAIRVALADQADRANDNVVEFRRDRAKEGTALEQITDRVLAALPVARQAQAAAVDEAAETEACIKWAEVFYRHADGFEADELEVAEAAWLERARRAAAQAMPTDLSKRLRVIAAGVTGKNPVLVYPECLTDSADEIERYYGGMLAWKRTAEAKDREFVATQAAPANRPSHETIVREGDSLVCTACGTSADSPADVRDAALAELRNGLCKMNRSHDCEHLIHQVDAILKRTNTPAGEGGQQ